MNGRVAKELRALARVVSVGMPNAAYMQQQDNRLDNYLNIRLRNKTTRSIYKRLKAWYKKTGNIPARGDLFAAVENLNG